MYNQKNNRTQETTERPRKPQPQFTAKRGHSLLKDSMGSLIQRRETAEFLFGAGLVPLVYFNVEDGKKRVVAVSIPSEQFSFAKRILVWLEEREEKEKAKRGRKFGSRG
jgi:hypothetical protein